MRPQLIRPKGPTADEHWDSSACAAWTERSAPPRKIGTEQLMTTPSAPTSASNRRRWSAGVEAPRKVTCQPCRRSTSAAIRAGSECHSPSAQVTTTWP
jgi:hypothetical protein